MGGSVSVPKDKKVLVVGGGYAGSSFALKLIQAGADVTLVDPKDYFFHNVGTVRAAIDSSFLDKLYIPYEKTFGSSFKQGKVVDINCAANEVVLESGEQLQYDLLVIATGCVNQAPFKYDPNVEDQHANKTIMLGLAEKVKAASKVAVIGGGPSGVEICAEIKQLYSDKEILLFHSSDELVYKGAPAKFQKQVKSKLEQRGVQLVLGQRVSNLDEISAARFEPCEVRTQDGQSYSVDCAINCTGTSKINLQFAKNSLGGAMDDKGQLKVNKYLQVDGHANIFALGDCNNADLSKTAIRVEQQVPVAVKNATKFLRGETQLKEYRGDPGPHFDIAVTLGKQDGVLTYSGRVLPTFVIVRVKSRDMLASKYWSGLKQTIPK